MQIFKTEDEALFKLGFAGVSLQICDEFKRLWELNKAELDGLRTH